MNVLSSVQIAILIVSSDFRIRRFTPMAERIMNLIASDVGRPIGHIKPNLDAPDLEVWIREAIDTVVSVERNVQDRQGNWYSLRIRPYKGVDNRIDGAVLALFDIDALHRREVELHEMRQYAEAVVDAVEQPLVVLDDDLRMRTANAAFLATFGVTGEGIDGRPFWDIADPAAKGDEIRRALAPLVKGAANGRIVLRHVTPRSGGRPMRIEARRIEGPAGRPPLVLLAFVAEQESHDGRA
jgi:two-component system CheB/CheR fusion protein